MFLSKAQDTRVGNLLQAKLLKDLINWLSSYTHALRISGSACRNTCFGWTATQILEIFNISWIECYSHRKQTLPPCPVSQSKTTLSSTLGVDKVSVGSISQVFLTKCSTCLIQLVRNTCKQRQFVIQSQQKECLAMTS